MNSSEKENKRNGIIGTILFHSLLLVAFLFLGLTYQDPPPTEEGISINFGFVDEGSDVIKPESKEENIEIIQQEVIEQKTEITEEIVTQDISETPAIQKTKEEETIIKEEIKEPEVIEKVEPKINIKALYPGKKDNSKRSEGNNNGEGDQGIIDGDSESLEYEGGGIGENGDAYQLGDRNVEFKPKPIYEIQVEGKVVVLITVDRSGNVTNATPGVKGSTTLNKKLLQRAKTAALRTKFSPKISAPNNQQGRIIYHFNLN